MSVEGSLIWVTVACAVQPIFFFAIIYLMAYLAYTVRVDTCNFIYCLGTSIKRTDSDALAVLLLLSWLNINWRKASIDFHASTLTLGVWLFEARGLPVCHAFKCLDTERFSCHRITGDEMLLSWHYEHVYDLAKIHLFDYEFTQNTFSIYYEQMPSSIPSWQLKLIPD